MQRLGAAVSVAVGGETTHVVARAPGTSKVLEAARRRVHVVHLDWLWFTVWFGARSDEATLRLIDTALADPAAVEAAVAANAKLLAAEAEAEAEAERLASHYGTPDEMTGASSAAVSAAREAAALVDDWGGDSESDDDDLDDELERAVGAE